MILKNVQNSEQSNYLKDLIEQKYKNMELTNLQYCSFTHDLLINITYNY